MLMFKEKKVKLEVVIIKCLRLNSRLLSEYELAQRMNGRNGVRVRV